MQTQRTRAILAAVVVVVVFVFVLSITRADRSRDLILQVQPIDPTDEVTVYVGGAVEDPGLYSLPRGSRVQDAIDLAGVLDTADTSGVAFAGVVQDEQSIILPETPGSGSETSAEADSTGGTSVPVSDVSDRINVNTASVTELEELPGIGPAIAQRIVTYRDENGPFTSVGSLSDVSGISERMVNEIQTLVAVED